jgi:hypothetical protein
LLKVSDGGAEAEDTGAEGEAKRKRLRSNVLKELLNTETTYFTQLKTLDFSFIQLLKNRKDLKVRARTRQLSFSHTFSLT